MAKLAVLISIPRKYLTHCPSFLLANTSSGGKRGREREELDGQGVVLSDNRTPFSLASCSRAMGMNEPGADVSLLMPGNMSIHPTG